jgi:hypothetical protein
LLAVLLWTAHGVHLDRWTWRAIRRRPRLACLALFAALTLVETWPLATNLARLSRNDNGDTMLNEWILAWVAHQAPRDPLHLFQANIFYPESNSLAFSESMLVQSALAMPMLWAGASPVLAYNVVLLAGFALTGWAMCIVIARWTGDWAAGIAAGILMAFNAHTLTRLPHLQAQHVEFLPFALLALDRVLTRPRLRHAFQLAFWFTLQGLASFYLLVISAMGLVAAAIVRTESWRGRRGLAVAKCLTAAAVLATIVLLPYLLPYWRANHDLGMTRPLESLDKTSWQDYLTTPARLDYVLLERFTSFTGLFPGFLGLALTIFAVAQGALRDPRARMCLALGVCGVALSFGAALPGYAVLYWMFPPLHGIRAVSRFGYLGLVAVAALSGFGTAEIRRRLRRPAFASLAGVVIALALTIESLAAPIDYLPFEGIPPIYHRLDGERDAVVAELPLPMHRAIFANAPFMLNSTTSWYRLLNGYSGFIPESYFTHYDALHDFPAPAAVVALQRFGVTHIFVHLDSFTPGDLGILRQSRGLRLIAQEQSVALYQVMVEQAGRPAR